MSVTTAQLVVSPRRFTVQSPTVSWSSDTTTGNNLLAFVAWSLNNSATITTDLTATGWTLLGSSSFAGTSGLQINAYQIENADSRLAANAETVTFSASPACAVMLLVELAGAATTTSIDFSDFAANGTGTTLSESVTTTLANELALAVLVNRNNDLQSIASGVFPTPVTGSNPVPNTTLAASGTNISLSVVTPSDSTAASSYPLSTTIPNSRNWAGIGLSVKPAGGGGGGGTSVSPGFIRLGLDMTVTLASLVLTGANTEAFLGDHEVWRWPTALSGEPVQPPDITLEATSSITTTNAVLNATVDPQGQDTTVVFEITSATLPAGGADFTAATIITAPLLPPDFGPGIVSVSATSLSPSTTYFIRATATNLRGSTQTSVASFTTSVFIPPSGPPLITTQPALLSASLTSISVSYAVDMNGAPGDVFLEQQTGAAWSVVDTHTAVPPSGPQALTSIVTGLASSTSFTFRVRATNPNAPSPSGTLSSTLTASTLTPLAIPIPTLGAPVSLNATTEQLNGQIANITQDIVAYHWELGTTTAYGTNSGVFTASPSPGGTVQVSINTATFAGTLAGQTTYHYRLVAARSDGQGGTQVSADGTFTTPVPPPAPQPDPLIDPADGITTSTATLHGHITMLPPP